MKIEFSKTELEEIRDIVIGELETCYKGRVPENIDWAECNRKNLGMDLWRVLHLQSILKKIGNDYI